MFHITEWSNVEGSSVGDVVELTGIVIKQDMDTVAGSQVVVVQSEPQDSVGKAPFEVWGVHEGVEIRVGERISFSGVVSRVTDSKDVIVDVDSFEVVSADVSLSDETLDTVERLIDEVYGY